MVLSFSSQGDGDRFHAMLAVGGPVISAAMLSRREMADEYEPP